MGIGIGIVGRGQLGRTFTEVFRVHSPVDRLVLCNRERPRAKAIERPGFVAPQ